MTSPSTHPAAPPAGAAAVAGWIDSRAALILIGLIVIAPLLVVGLPPLVDLYGHVGRYAVQTELAARPELQPFYSYQWKLIGNLGADILVQALHPLLGLEGSVRAVVIATQLLGAAGILLVTREIHGRVTPFALLALPLLYGYPFNYGFINYALSMALALLAFAAWLRLQRREDAWRARLWLAVSGAGIWVCHTYGWAFLGLLTGSAMLAEVIAARTPPVAAVRRILAACWPLLLPIAPMIVWRAGAQGSAQSLSWPLNYKLIWLISPLRTMWHAFDVASAGFLALVVVVAAIGRKTFFEKRLGVAALVSWASFWMLPSFVFGSAFADMRLVPYALALSVMAISPARLGPRALLAVTAIAFAFFAGRSASTAAAYAAQDRVVAGVLPALDAMPKGAKVAYFVVKPCTVRWQLPILDHVAGLALARRSVFVNDQWQQAGVNPLIVHYPPAGKFASDPSHLVRPAGCGAWFRLNITEALEQFPRAAFTHVWIVDEVPALDAIPADLEPVPNSGTGLLLKVKRAP